MIIIRGKGVCVCVRVCKMHFGILAWWFIIWVMPSLLPQSCTVLLPINLESVVTTYGRAEAKRENETGEREKDTGKEREIINKYFGWSPKSSEVLYFCVCCAWLIPLFCLLLMCAYVISCYVPSFLLSSNAIDLCNRLLVLFFFRSPLNSSIFHFSLFCCFYNNRGVIFHPLRFTFNPVHAMLSSYFSCHFSRCALHYLIAPSHSGDTYFSLALLSVHLASFSVRSHTHTSHYFLLLIHMKWKTQNEDQAFVFNRYQIWQNWEQSSDSSPEITLLLPSCEQQALLCCMCVYWWGLCGTSLCFTSVTVIAVYYGCR